MSDEWLLVDNRPQRVGGARGTYLGSIRHANGRLAAVLGQRVLLRMPSPYARPPASEADAGGR